MLLPSMHSIIRKIAAISIASIIYAYCAESDNKLNPPVEFSPKLVQEAESGDVNAEFALGLCYFWGRGVAQSDEDAIKWLSKAAEKEHVRAMHLLGAMYFNGKNKNETKAFAYLQKAADLNDLPSMPFLAECFFDGVGTNKNQKEAFKWYLKSAEAGDINSQRMVGLIYKYNFDKGFETNGNKLEVDGVEQSLEKAEYWFDQASKKDDEFSLEELVSIKIENRKEIDAFKILWEKVKENKTASCRIFAELNSTGRYWPRNIEAARTWYYQGWKLGDNLSLVRLGRSFAKDEPKNIPGAIMYLEKAKTEKELSLSDQNLLEELKKQNIVNNKSYVSKIRVEVPSIQNYEVFAKAELNDGFALFRIGTCYEKGDGIQKNLEKALQYFTKSSEASDPSGIYQMGLEYQSGRILKQDKEIAFKNFLKAAEMGSPVAAYTVGKIFACSPYSLMLDKETTIRMADDPHKKDLGKAIHWLTKAFEDIGTAQTSIDPLINALLENGQREEALKIIPKSRKWAQNAMGKYFLGKMYYEGKSGDKNIEEGKKLLLESSQLSYAPAAKFCELNGIVSAASPQQNP